MNSSIGHSAKMKALGGEGGERGFLMPSLPPGLVFIETIR